MQQRGKGYLWIPRTVVSTTDSDEIPIMLLNLTNCSLKISNKQVLTHAQLIGDCVTNIMELSDNPLEVKATPNSATSSSSFGKSTHPSTSRVDELHHSGEDSSQILHRLDVEPLGNNPSGRQGSSLHYLENEPLARPSCLGDHLRGDDTLLGEDNDFQCNTTVAQSNLRVDEDGWLFIQPTPTTSTNQEQLKKDILGSN
jgi:hypothetical protein